MKTQVLTSIDEVTREEWNALRGAGQPFLRHEFLAALEHHDCVGADAGWMPHHLTLRDDAGRLIGALPLYRKSHSWGEFVFDFAWAQAYAHHGLNYYPKLLAAVPFTPATGPRFLLTENAPSTLLPTLLKSAIELAHREHDSSLHILFAEKSQAEALAAQGLLLRRDCQFHWFNHDYPDFESFLGQFTAEKRKKVHRERRRVQEAGVTFTTLHGGDIEDDLWDQLYAFHAETFLRHRHTPYLSVGFFKEVAALLPEHVVVQLASHQSRPVAAAICFRSEDTLYGRYWGASADFHSLHFEACYYQGVDYCIRNGLKRFEPGTQGEHKVSRGFVPAYTWSAHWIADARFRGAIADYLERESQAVTDYAAEIGEHIPYKQIS